MDTHFAPAERTSAEALAAEVLVAARSPILGNVMEAVGGMIAVLNEQRQVVAANDALLRGFDVKDSAAALGLRLGQVVRCAHAEKPPAGCGTTRHCASCGAAIATVTAIGEDRTCERICALDFLRCGKRAEASLRVRASPLVLDGHRFILLFIQDITRLQQWAATERVFLHDAANIAGTLLGASELLATAQGGEVDLLLREVQNLSQRLQHEVICQRALAQGDVSRLIPALEDCSVSDLVTRLKSEARSHPVASGKRIVAEVPEDTLVRTDGLIALRVLGNMLLNALEATDEQGEVQIGAKPEDGAVSFWVRNGAEIPPAVQLRIFQKHFSTRPGDGRGLGTYSMKLFGEQVLGGEVSFTSSPAEGTTFRLKLPRG